MLGLVEELKSFIRLVQLKKKKKKKREEKGSDMRSKSSTLIILLSTYIIGNIERCGGSCKGPLSSTADHNVEINIGLAMRSLHLISVSGGVVWFSQGTSSTQSCMF